MPVLASTVSTSRGAPPNAKAALSRLSERPGMDTSESLGSESSTGSPTVGRCISIMVSVRAPATPGRASEPTSRTVVPGWSAGRSPAGVASTRVPMVQAISGVTRRNTSHSASSVPMNRRTGRRRRVRRRAALGGTGGGRVVALGRAAAGRESADASGAGKEGMTAVGSGWSGCSCRYSQSMSLSLRSTTQGPPRPPARIPAASGVAVFPGRGSWAKLGRSTAPKENPCPHRPPLRRRASTHVAPSASW